MPRCLLRITLPVLLACLTRALPATSDEQKPGQDLPPKFETRINESLAAGKFRDAITAVAQYGEAVRGCYAAPSYTDGRFQSEAEHLSLQCPFPGWTVVDPTPANRPMWLPWVGLDITLLLRHPQDAGTLAIVSSDIGHLQEEPGVSSEAETASILELFARLQGQRMGTARYRSFSKVGNLRLLSVELSGKEGNVVEMRMFVREDRLYAVLLTGAPSEKAEMQAKLLTVLKSMDLHYKPSQKERVAAIRAKVTDPKDVKQQLQDIRDLVLNGEYNAAAEDLRVLRLTINKLIPQAHVVGDEMHYDGYGVTVINPDPTVWRGVIGFSHHLSQMTLQSRTGVAPHGIIVTVNDPVDAYGVVAERLLSEKASENDKKIFLEYTAHVGSQNIGVVLESGRLRTFRGMLAYECMFTSPVANVKTKIINVLRSPSLLTIVLQVDPKNADQHFTEYEAVLEKALTLK